MDKSNNSKRLIAFFLKVSTNSPNSMSNLLSLNSSYCSSWKCDSVSTWASTYGSSWRTLATLNLEMPVTRIEYCNFGQFVPATWNEWKCNKYLNKLPTLLISRNLLEQQLRQFQCYLLSYHPWHQQSQDQSGSPLWLCLPEYFGLAGAIW